MYHDEMGRHLGEASEEALQDTTDRLGSRLDNFRWARLAPDQISDVAPKASRNTASEWLGQTCFRFQQTLDT